MPILFAMLILIRGGSSSSGTSTNIEGNHNQLVNCNKTCWRVLGCVSSLKLQQLYLFVAFQLLLISTARMWTTLALFSHNQKGQHCSFYMDTIEDCTTLSLIPYPRPRNTLVSECRVFACWVKRKTKHSLISRKRKAHI